MRLIYNKTSKGKYYYIIRSVYLNGKNTSKVYEKLGYLEDIKKKYQCDDPEKWIQDHLNELNEAEKENKNVEVLVPLNPNIRIPLNEPQTYEIGYLFLQKIYYELRLDLVCKNITKRHSSEYNLNSILSRLIYARILDPASELSVFETANKYLEPPEFEFNEIESALSVLAEESDYIQAELYKYSSRIIPQNTRILYYDFTDILHDIDYDDSLSDQETDEKGIVAGKYSVSEQQPGPLVRMGLFTDYSGIPLAMRLDSGSEHEQQALIPLEQKIMQDFESARFVICTDSGPASENNLKYNNFGSHALVAAVSIKTMNESLQKWCLDPEGWHLEGDSRTYNINEAENTDDKKSRYCSRTFYKETDIAGYDTGCDTGHNRTLVMTYSRKYKDYLVKKRSNQIQKEEAAQDKRFDGFYAVETDLTDSVHDIIRIIRGRWEIEESFRFFKNEFPGHLVYSCKSDLLKAHFLICYISLLVYRILENKLGAGRFDSREILSALKELKLKKEGDLGFSPDYTRTELTDALHEISEFNTDMQIIRTKTLKGILAKSKKR